MASGKFRNFITRILRILAWLLVSVLLLVFIVFVSLQFPGVQTYIAGRVAAHLSEETGGVISIDRVAIRLPGALELRGIYIEDPEGDTLVYAGGIYADIALMHLLRSRAHINSIEIEDLTASIIRKEPDSVFNFQFLADAFAGPQENDTSSGRSPGNEQNAVGADEPDNQEDGFSFFLDRIKLHNINILYEDHFSGIRLNGNLGDLQTSLADSDLLNNKYHAGNTVISQTTIRLVTTEPSVPAEEPEEAGPEPDISVASLELAGFEFYLENQDGGRLEFLTTHLEIVPDMIDLRYQLVRLESIHADNLNVSIISPPETEDGGTAAVLPDEPAAHEPGFRFSEIMEWTVGLSSLEITNSRFLTSIEGSPLSTEEFDAGNFSLDNLNINAGNIYAAPDSVRIDIRSMSMLVSEALSLNQLELDAVLGSASGAIDLNMVTNGSRLEFRMEMEADLLDFILEDLFDRTMMLAIENTLIAEDIAFFAPGLRSYYFNRPGDRPIEISTLLRGMPSAMTIDSLRISGPELFAVFARGDVVGLPETDNLFLDIENFELWVRPGPVMAIIPDFESPEGIGIPESLQVEGQFRGTARDFESGLMIRSGLGNIEIAAAMSGNEMTGRSFNGSLVSSSFDIAGLMQGETPQQPVSLELEFNGKGLEPGSMELEAGLVIGQLMLMDYEYDGISLFAGLLDSTMTISTAYKDDYLSFDLVAAMGIFKEIPTAEGDLNIEYADLNRLGISEEELMVSTSLGADIILRPEDFFSGLITVSRTDLAIGGEIRNIPAIHIVSASGPEDYSLEIISDFISAVYKGNISPAAIPNTMGDHLSRYFTIPETEDLPDNPTVNETSPEPAEPEETDEPVEKYFTLELNLYPSDLISLAIMPAVEEYDTLSVFIDYDSYTQQLTMDAIMEEIEYAGMELRNFVARITSDREKMDFGISIENLNINETFLYEIDLSGSLHDEKIDLSFSFKDEERQDIFLIGAEIESLEELIHFSIDPENLIINYANWDIHPENRIIAGQGHLRFNNFIIEHAGSMLSVNSIIPEDETDYDDITEIEVSRLDIHSLTGFADKIIPLKGGMLDGTMTLRNTYGETSFTADINIEGLTWSDQTIETIKFFAEDAGPNHIYLEAALEHQGTSLRASGDYFPGEEPSVDLEIILDNLDMQLVEMFAGDELADVSGVITGRIRVEGNLSSPEITGEMQFSEAGFRVTQLNASYFLKDEQIRFDRNTVNFRDFTIEDRNGRTATIDGSVNIENTDNLVFNLNLSTGNFLLMNLPERRGEMYYGTIFMDSNLSLRGSHTSPSLSGRLRLREGSAFTFVVPQSTPEAIGGEGVVEFLSPDQEGFHRKIADMEEPDELRSSLEVMTVSLNIEIDRETQMRVIIDEIAGDYLEIQGGGVLSFGIDPGGAINLTGRYEITEGEYLLSFHDVARRKFSIQEGSNIIFTGDPMEAELDITAIYTVRTSADPLMRAVGQAGQQREERGRRQLPFLVYLNLEGELMSPDISFGLDMPPEHQDAYDGSLMGRINAVNNDESERNKQVFALLILGNFIHESPFATGGGPGIATTARSSASQILSQQLNRLSDRYVRGIDISFELESYEMDRGDEAFGRTELQVEVSRDFFDDRVRVMVGGNIELEDDTHRETRPGDIAGDFTLEYLLTPGGDLLLRGFRKREYGDIIEGELTTTGVSVVFSRSYTRFRDLFRLSDDDTPAPLEEAEVIDPDNQNPE